MVHSRTVKSKNISGAGDAAQCTQKAPAVNKLGMVAHSYNPSTWENQEFKAILGHIKGSLGYRRQVFKWAELIAATAFPLSRELCGTHSPASRRAPGICNK